MCQNHLLQLWQVIPKNRFHCFKSLMNMKQWQTRYEAAKERRDRLALDLKIFLKSIASLDDMLSINLKKLLNDVREDSPGDGKFYSKLEVMYGITSI